MKDDLGLGLEGEQERINFGSLDGGKDALDVESSGTGVVALDLAGPDWSNRWEVFTQGTAVVKLNPE